MVLEALTIGAVAQGALRTSAGPWIVVASFDSAIYLSDGGRVIAITARQVPPGPIYVTVDADRLFAKDGQALVCHDGHLLLGQYSISLSSAHVWQGRLPDPEASDQVSEYQPARPEIRIEGLELAAAPTLSLALWAAEVVEKESPVHASEVARRILSEAGVKRPGRRVQTAIDEAVTQLVESGRVSRRGDFLWRADMERAPVRDRSGLPAVSRRLEMVSDEELAEAVCMVVGQSYGIAREQTPVAALKLLGYSRVTNAMKARFDGVVGGLLSEGRLEDDGGNLVLADVVPK